MQNSPVAFPDNSLDWRFLLPITAASKILIVGHECGHIQQYFMKLGFSDVYYCTDKPSQVTNSSNNKTQQNIIAYSDLEMRSELFSFFDAVLYPHGFFKAELSSSEAESYSYIKKFVRSGGILFIGFTNGFFSKKDKFYYSYLWKIKKALKKSGYTLTGAYGATPDQFSPEYVFPLTPQAISFIIRHRYVYKVSSMLLRLLASPFAARLLVYLFPAYFVTATADSM